MNPIEVYTNVSCIQLSIARYYGGATVNGSHYRYDPSDDSLIRADVLKRREKEAKAAKQRAKQSCIEKQNKLL